MTEERFESSDSVPTCADTYENVKANDNIYNQPVNVLDLDFDTELPVHSQDISASKTKAPDLTQYGSPYEWPFGKKASIMVISCISTMLASFASSSYSPALQQLEAEWGVSSVAISVGVTTFTTGFAVGPMPLSPFSEIKGRKSVFVATAILFVICQVCTSVTRSFPGMLVVRFFAGVGGSTFSTMVGGIVADMYPSKTRNTPMAIFAGSSLFGIGFGPLVCGFIAENTTWRWIFYMQSILAAIMCVSVLFFFPETRSLVILRRKVIVLNSWYDKLEKEGYYGHIVSREEGQQGKEVIKRIRWTAVGDERKVNLVKLITTSLYRPFKFLVTEPVVFFFSLWMAFSWAVLYINISAVPMVFQTQYGFSLSNSNAVLTSTCVACIIATVLAITQDRIAERSPTWNTVPEHRLYFSCVESFLLAIGLFMFGWTSAYRVHWIVPTIALGLNTVGIYSIYLAIFNYFADTYHQYASSTIAAQSFCRNLIGGVFPLVSRQLFHNLGPGPAGSLLGGIATLLTLVPWVLVLFGPTIRAKSKLASAMNANSKSEKTNYVLSSYK